jgi:outer membrane lipoprotein SlyB
MKGITMSFGKVLATLFFAVAAISSNVASAQDMSGSHYGRGEHRRVQATQLGKVEAVRRVTLNTEASDKSRMIGGAVGAAVGGLLGAKRNQNYAVSSLFAVLGGAGGAMIADKVAYETRDALEIVVRLDSGNAIVLVQEVDPQYPIYAGDRVRLIEGREVRVAPIG